MRCDNMTDDGHDSPRDERGQFQGDPGGPKFRVPALPNSVTHGLRSRAIIMPLAALSNRFRYVMAQVNSFRHLVEAEVVAQHGEVSLPHASIIATCCQIERARRIVERLFADNLAILAPEKLVDIQTKVVNLSNQRDQALAKLGLERSEHPSKLWDSLHGTPASSSRKEDA